MKNVLIPVTPSIDEILKDDFFYPEYAKDKERLPMGEALKRVKKKFEEDGWINSITYSYVVSAIALLQEEYETKGVDVTDEMKMHAYKWYGSELENVLNEIRETVETKVNDCSLIVHDLEFRLKKVFKEADLQGEIDELKSKLADLESKLKSSPSKARIKAYRENKIKKGDLKLEDMDILSPLSRLRRELENVGRVLNSFKLTDEEYEMLEDMTIYEQCKYLQEQGYIDQNGYRIKHRGKK